VEILEVPEFDFLQLTNENRTEYLQKHLEEMKGQMLE